MTEIKHVVVLGGPGDGTVIAEAVLQLQESGKPIRLAGFLNDSLEKGTELHGAPVLGKLEDWATIDPDFGFCPALQKVKEMPQRIDLLESLEVPEERWITVIHPKAAVSSDCIVGRGVFVASCATVQPECQLGDFSSLRAGAMLGHHCSIDNHAYVGPNATMCGRSSLGLGAHLGPGATLMEEKRMQDFSVAGINAAVTKDVREGVVVFGNPAIRVGYIWGYAKR